MANCASSLVTGRVSYHPSGMIADSSSRVIKRVMYHPFGGAIEDTKPDLRIPLGFVGGLHDKDLGFVRFG